MRVSAAPTDPGFIPDASGIRVYLDGVERFDVVTADEEQGLIVFHPRNAEGKLFANAQGDEIATAEARGTVKVVMP